MLHPYLLYILFYLLGLLCFPRTFTKSAVLSQKVIVIFQYFFMKLLLISQDYRISCKFPGLFIKLLEIFQDFYKSSSNFPRLFTKLLISKTYKTSSNFLELSRTSSNFRRLFRKLLYFSRNFYRSYFNLPRLLQNFFYYYKNSTTFTKYVLLFLGFSRSVLN